MMRIFLFILSLFMSLFLAGCHLQTQNIIEKKEVADPYTWDFGRVKEGEVLKHNFILKNEAKKIVNIKDVNTSCGCAVSKVEKKTLLPQESTSIEVQFKTQGYAGQVQQYIYVHTDNLDNPILRFIIKAEILK